MYTAYLVADVVGASVDEVGGIEVVLLDILIIVTGLGVLFANHL